MRPCRTARSLRAPALEAVQALVPALVPERVLLVLAQAEPLLAPRTGSRQRPCMWCCVPGLNRHRSGWQGTVAVR